MAVSATALVTGGKVKYRVDLIEHIDRFVKLREGKTIIVTYEDNLLDESERNRMVSYYKRDVLPAVFDMLTKNGASVETLDDVDWFLVNKFMPKKKVTSPFTGDILIPKRFKDLDEVSMVDFLSTISMWTTTTYRQSLPKIIRNER